MEIAYLDREALDAEQVRQWLEEAGHQCHHTPEHASLVDMLQQQAFDAVLMDWEVPGMTPIEVLRTVCERSNGTPVMLASRHSDQDSIVEALSVGADDFMVKPLTRNELLARLATLEWRTVRQQQGQNIFQLGPWEVDPDQRVIRVNGKPGKLTEKDFELASFFLRNPGKLLTRRELLREVWGINTPIQSRTVDVHVSRIRRSLQIGPRHGYRIRTVYQHGYRLEQVED